MYLDNDKKFTVVLNSKHPTGLLLNALGHALLGLTADLGAKKCEILDYRNDAASLLARISRFPVIVLKAKNGNQIRTTYERATKAGVEVNVFVTSMLGDSATAQMVQTAEADPDSLDYVAIAMFGDGTHLQPLTKRFSILSWLS